jgi:lambda family phage portal protein
MVLKDFIPSWLSLKNNKKEIASSADFVNNFNGGHYRNVYTISFDGEKNLGEAGPIIKYNLDYESTRLRSWQALIESEVVQTIISKYCTWIIGDGLKLTCEPSDFVLLQEGITLNKIEFSKNVEQRFNLYKNSKDADYSGMETLDSIANTAFKNALVGGDVLVVLRYENNEVNVQLIDGCHVCSPEFGSEQYPKELTNGNQLINGIEVDAKKKHVRYYVRNKNFTFDIIEAVGKNSGLQTAFLVKGLDYRLDNVRGLPLVAPVLEKLKKMERYESATLSSAEERAKIVYYIKHTKQSSGETPLTKQLAKAANYGAKDDIPTDLTGKQLADQIGVSTNKQVFNMEMDSELQALESKQELQYKEYNTENVTAVCAAINMPYQIAMSKYEGNFSASRAALKDWENTMKVKRKLFANSFYQPIFNFWLEVKILQNKISAPGYLKARLDNNLSVIEAYRKCRFIGAGVPHIDPLKEVNAIREALGETGKDLPLITYEEACEKLYGSESNDNMIQYADELKSAKKLGIETVVPKTTIEKTAS